MLQKCSFDIISLVMLCIYPQTLNKTMGPAIIDAVRYMNYSLAFFIVPVIDMMSCTHPVFSITQTEYVCNKI